MKKNGKTHVQVNKLHMVFSKEGKTHEKYELLLKIWLQEGIFITWIRIKT
jgi:hypothetical protein